MLNETEIKLLRLALDSGAQPGEIANAALLLIRKLRKRQASVDDFKQHYPEVATLRRLCAAPLMKCYGEIENE